MDIKEEEAIKAAVEAARERPPVAISGEFSCVREAKIGSPVMVYTSAGEPSFWLVPFLQEDAACGYAQVGLSQNVDQISIFGGSADDIVSWIDASYFEKPPEKFLSEIKQRYPPPTLSNPVFSFDKVPSKWGWRLEMKEGNVVRSVIFINPRGWYEKPPDVIGTDFEG